MTVSLEKQLAPPNRILDAALGPTQTKTLCKKALGEDMPLYEIETDAHIIITWADDEASARDVAADSYPHENILRLTKRPRSSWVISKGLLGIASKTNPCSVARDCLSKSSGDKVHAIRLYMQETGDDLEKSRKVIETNMVMGW